MKKLLVLMLVLGLATTANAALSLKVNDSAVADMSIDKNAVSGITIQVVSDDDSNWLGYLILNDGGDGVLSGAVTYNVSAHTDGGFAGAQGSHTPYSYTGWGAGYEYTTAQSGSPTDVLPGTQHTAYLDVSTLDIGDSGVISLWDSRIGYEQAVDSFMFTIIPEPATIALLGLGGLFLRRRK